MKKFIKSKYLKIFSLLLTFVLFLSFSPINVSALTENNPHVVLNDYLTAIQNKDILSATNLSTDYRVSNKLDYQNWLSQLLNDPNQQISHFTILNKDVQYTNYSIVYAEIEFLNGDIVEVPFRIQDEIVHIDKMDNLPKIKTGVDLPYSEITPRAQVVYWSTVLSLAPNNPDTIYTSKFSYNANSTTLNFRQYTADSAPVAAKVEYAVVEKGIFSDTVYSSKVVSGDNSSSAKQITLTLGTGQTFDNFSIRIDNYNYSYSTTVYGEAYCY